MSKWGDWMALLSSWALQCVLWRVIPACGEAEDAGCCWKFAVSCPHFHGRPAPMHLLVPACSLLLDVLHWGTLGQEDDFRSLKETGDWGWELTDNVYQSTLSSRFLEMEEFCPNNVFIVCSRSPWRKVIVVKIYSLLIFQLFPTPTQSLGAEISVIFKYISSRCLWDALWDFLVI